MLLDGLMPEFDATRIEHRVIDGRPTAVYDAAIHAGRLNRPPCGCSSCPNTGTGSVSAKTVQMSLRSV